MKQLASEPLETYVNQELTPMLEAGMQAQHKGKFEEAITLYLTAQRKDLNDVRAYTHLARILTGVGLFREALPFWLMVCENKRIDPAAVADADAYTLLISKHQNHSLNWDNSTIPASTVLELISNTPTLKKCAVHPDNVTFYMGYCIVVPNQQRLSKKLPAKAMETLQHSLLKQPSTTATTNNTLLDPNLEHTFLLSAIAFIHLNLSPTPFTTLADAAAHYLNKEWSPNLNLALIKHRKTKNQSAS